MKLFHQDLYWTVFFGDSFPNVIFYAGIFRKRCLLHLQHHENETLLRTRRRFSKKYQRPSPGEFMSIMGFGEQARK